MALGGTLRLRASGRPAFWRDPPSAWVAAGLTLGGGLFYLAPSLPLSLLALAAVALLAWLRLDLGLALVPLFLPDFMAPKHLGGKLLPPSEVFLGVDVLVAGLYLVTGRRERLRFAPLLRSPFLPPACLLLAAGALSTVFAAAHAQAMRAYLEVVIEPLLWASLLLVAVRGRDWLWIVIGAVCGAVCAALIGLGQYATHEDLTLVPGTSVERIHALYGSPVNLGLLFDRALPLWLPFLLLYRRRRTALVALAAAGCAMVAALVLTNSSAAWAASALGCLAMLAVLYRWGRIALAGFLLLLAVGALLEGPRLAHVFRSGQNITTERRVAIWQSSLHMLRGHPLFGVGPDNFIHYYAPSRDKYSGCPPGLDYIEPAAADEPCLSHPHNLVLDFWLSTGMLGLAAFLWIEIVFWRAVRPVVRGGPLDWRRGLLLGAGGAMIASLVHGLVDNFYFLVDLSALFWLLCALVSSLGSTARAPDQTASTGP